MGTTCDHILAAGNGWSVSDVACTAGPGDRPYEERHGAACIAVVTAGTFVYRSSRGTALLNPGAVLLGNPGSPFECSHEHGTGDRCLSFHLAPAYLESIASEVPGVRSTAFAAARLPPSWRLMPLLAQAEAAREASDGQAFEELAVRLAAAVTATLAGSARRARAPRSRDARRISAALRRIEARACDPLTLNAMARDAAMSAYHFLRVFRQLVGMTPHQFVLRTRLQRAAVRLCRSDEGIAAIAFSCGFNDLSTFNRRFRKITGASPGAFRKRHGVRARTAA